MEGGKEEEGVSYIFLRALLISHRLVHFIDPFFVDLLCLPIYYSAQGYRFDIDVKTRRGQTIRSASVQGKKHPSKRIWPPHSSWQGCDKRPQTRESELPPHWLTPHGSFI